MLDLWSHAVICLTDRNVYQSRWGCLNNDSSNNVLEQRYRSAAWCCLVYLIIKYLFISQVIYIYFLLFSQGFASVCFSAASICHLLFRSERISFSSLFFFFLFVLTPDKTHRLWGNWSWGSCFVLAALSEMAINQVMYCVRGRPFSIQFMTCHEKKKKKKADATKVLKVCRVHYSLMWWKPPALLYNNLYVKMRPSCGAEAWLLHRLYNINILSWLFSTDHVLLEWFKQNKRAFLLKGLKINST